MENGVRRQLVDISLWNPSLDQFSELVSLLPLHEQSSITRFIKFEDRKRALVSRLLQYVVVHEVLGLPLGEIIINRTVEGKPYLGKHPARSKIPNFNFNCSHDGDYVAIASEPLCLIGLDIVYPSIPTQETVNEFIGNFSSYFTRLEWHKITNAGISCNVLAEFYRYWCMKEAYVKATGAGVGFRLDRLEFHHTNWVNISVYIDGKQSKVWRFWLLELEKGHLAALAKGHPQSATKNYKSALRRTEFDEEEYYSSLNLENPGFDLCPVEKLSSKMRSTDG
ncbi:hypothetical protein H6P81_007864 [Aristolochia fimbriata]|uniref:holo-[acyl-carrier-protein] synthase n=1 Tax=Aristolochia fimbriata TaxID=158543 RepID=A0AAV7F3R2_ARIFI|nr:hypothetical protein H6P81_007864 [Aristolochia fimbriata]